MVKIDTRTIQIKTPLQILKQAYGAEVIMKFLYGLPICLPKGLREIDIESHLVEHLLENNCRPAMKGYKDFPADISISRNHVITHGIPSVARISNNDILTVDVVCEHQGMYCDMSFTYGVGEIQKELQELLQIAWKVCRSGLCAVQIGNTLSDVALAIQQEADRHKVFLYNQFVGHGIGQEIHELPYVHYNIKSERIPIVPGMVLCIEPIISLKAQKVAQKDCSYVGRKLYPTAVYEHMVGIFENSARVLSYGMLQPQHLPELPPQFLKK